MSPPGPSPREDGALKPFRAYKVRFHTPLFIPAEHADSLDHRSLGFRFHEVKVVAL